MAACVTEGMESPEPAWPGQRVSKRVRPPALLQQFLTAAMAPTSVAATTLHRHRRHFDDVRDLIVYWMEGAPRAG